MSSSWNLDGCKTVKLLFLALVVFLWTGGFLVANKSGFTWFHPTVLLELGGWEKWQEQSLWCFLGDHSFPWISLPFSSTASLLTATFHIFLQWWLLGKEKNLHPADELLWTQPTAQQWFPADLKPRDIIAADFARISIRTSSANINCDSCLFWRSF